MKRSILKGAKIDGVEKKIMKAGGIGSGNKKPFKILLATEYTEEKERNREQEDKIKCEIIWARCIEIMGDRSQVHWRGYKRNELNLQITESILMEL